MRVIAALPRHAKPAVRTIPLLERPAVSAAVPFDQIIHRAEPRYLPRQSGFFCHARVVEEPSAPRWLFSIAPTARKLDGERPDQVTREPRFCGSASFVARGEAGNCSTVACCPSHSRVSNTTCPSGNSNAS